MLRKADRQHRVVAECLQLCERAVTVPRAMRFCQFQRMGRYGVSTLHPRSFTCDAHTCLSAAVASPALRACSNFPDFRNQDLTQKKPKEQREREKREKAATAAGGAGAGAIEDEDDDEDDRDDAEASAGEGGAAAGSAPAAAAEHDEDDEDDDEDGE